MGKILKRLVSGKSSAALYMFTGFFLSLVFAVLINIGMQVADVLARFLDAPFIVFIPATTLALIATALFSVSLWLGIYHYFRLNRNFIRWVLIGLSVCHMVVVIAASIVFTDIMMDGAYSLAAGSSRAFP